MIDTHVDEIVNHPRRLIGLEAVHNFRDLGGYATADGRSTKWRTLFRSDGLYRLRGADDMSRVRQLGLKSVIDLRTEREQREQGIFPTDDIEVTFHHLSIVDVTWSDTETPEFDDEVEFLVWGYRDMLEIGSSRFADAMHVLAQTDSLPAVFHCAAGKDRTGLLAALLLSGLGVPDEIVYADYAMSELAGEKTREWAKVVSPEFAERFATMPPVLMSAHPDSIKGLLADIRETHGTIRDYCLTIGVEDQHWLALEEHLLETA